MADLQSYQSQLDSVEAALRAAPDDEELLKLREDLVELITSLNDLAKNEQAKPAPSTSAFRPGDKVLALSPDGEWHPARVERVSDKGFDVAFMGTMRGTKDLIAKLAVKPYTRPDMSVFTVGQTVSAWYADDRAFFKATVHGVDDDAVQVEYVGFEGLETLEAECVRPDGGESAMNAAAAGSRAGPSRRGPAQGAGAGADADAQGKKRPFQIPQSLEIKPDDTPEVVERKKKKIKAMSRKAALAEKEEAINEQRNSWQAFVTKKKDFKKLSSNNHDPRFDPERDHQEMARRYHYGQRGDKE